ncbi:MAG: hypothetical protein KC457_19510, partial [Myxococcales bacterium]|nr:hypothetical protein [Myxococcales bacterium]
VLAPAVEESLPYVLGLLNSRLLTYVHRLIAPPKGNNYFEVKTRILGRLPMRRINWKKKADKAAHDSITALVEQLLALHGRHASASTPHERTALARQIAAADAQVDRHVYALYDLTKIEIDLVERSTNAPGCSP